MEEMGDEVKGKPAQPREWLEQKEAITHPCQDGMKFKFGNNDVAVTHVPCHTRGHIVFYIQSPDSMSKVLACGDTVFVGGCGRFFEGTAEEMITNMAKLRQLPDDTMCLPAHEYTLGNFEFNASIDESLNEALAAIKAKRKRGEFTVPTTIGLEKQHNLFMNTEDNRIQQLVAKASGDDSCVGSAGTTMTHLRSMKNNFRG